MNKLEVRLSDSVAVEKSNDMNVYSLPIIDTAANVIGKPRVSKCTEELNKKALRMGYEIAEKVM